jgi:hypothetical protein
MLCEVLSKVKCVISRARAGVTRARASVRVKINNRGSASRWKYISCCLWGFGGFLGVLFHVISFMWIFSGERSDCSYLSPYARDMSECVSADEGGLACVWAQGDGSEQETGNKVHRDRSWSGIAHIISLARETGPHHPSGGLAHRGTGPLMGEIMCSCVLIWCVSCWGRRLKTPQTRPDLGCFGPQTPKSRPDLGYFMSTPAHSTPFRSEWSEMGRRP